MKLIIIAAVFSFLLAIDIAFAEEAVFLPSKGEMKVADQISEELLLREDLSEQLPAKEEKVIEQKSEEGTDLPAVAEQGESSDEAADAAPTAEDDQDSVTVDSPEMLAKSLEPKDEPGSLKYEMKTVDLLSDALPPATDDSHEEIAKR